MAKKENKKEAKLSFKSMVAAMILALLAFLGFGNFQLGDGDGADVDNGNTTVSESGVDATTQAPMEEVTTKAAEGEVIDESIYNIYVREDKIFIGSKDAPEEVSQSYIEEMLPTLDSDVTVIIYDDGAFNSTYEAIVDLVDASGLLKKEDVLK